MTEEGVFRNPLRDSPETTSRGSRMSISWTTRPGAGGQLFPVGGGLCLAAGGGSRDHRCPTHPDSEVAQIPPSRDR